MRINAHVHKILLHMPYLLLDAMRTACVKISCAAQHKIEIKILDTLLALHFCYITNFTWK